MLMDEVYEMLRETSWKNHRKDKPYMIESNMKEEWIDIFKYWLSIGLVWDFDPKDLIEEYFRKSEVVEQRYKQEKQLDFESGKIAGIDIDGVLAKYPEHFLDFINREVGTDLKVEDLDDYNIYEALDMPKELTKKLKDKFRQTGEKRFIPVFDKAKDFLKTIKENGYHIVLLSARPYKKYKRIFADTKEWLEKNELVHDAILWDEDKCNRLIREFGDDSVKFFVEDNLENANDVSETTKVYLIDRSYNQGEINKNVIRVDSYEQILRMECDEIDF